ncbi:hypothetical protein JDV02_005507 [Purpureocillium takamizusanense]|uniref:BTB domain-containing protein n=1 Tax=Purpureocillium takamizusanense TaxID=2060973 RepID=A0A9Q8QHJ8_9HYPO|nr:uncharacterized protein JDV02_005507 [Purpureocillium takamizusanense]UNI19316.1 hypothetical protein JDV02_005507 [Purpureocillium takamizusanense]
MANTSASTSAAANHPPGGRGVDVLVASTVPDASIPRDQTSRESTSAAVVVAAPGGDVVLVVGKRRARIQVFSVVLRNSSRVFEAMLRPEFAEGAKLFLNTHGSAPVDIELPEDDPDAMGKLCKMLHCTADAGASPGGAQSLLDLARAADKYDLVSRVVFPATQWLTELMKRPAVRDAELLLGLMAAYTLKHATGFANLSRALMMQHAGSWCDLLKGLPDVDGLAHELLVALEEARSYIHACVCETVNNLAMMSAINSCLCTLEKPDIVNRWFLGLGGSQFLTINLTTLQTLSIVHLSRDVYHLSHLGSDHLSGLRHVCGRNPRPLLTEVVYGIVAKKLASFKGLCLRCFDRKNRYVGATGGCRLAH